MPTSLGTLSTADALKQTITGVVTNTIIYVICTNDPSESQIGVIGTAAQVGSYNTSPGCPGPGYIAFNITANTTIYVYGDGTIGC
jgi:hypothetical protein